MKRGPPPVHPSTPLEGNSRMLRFRHLPLALLGAASLSFAQWDVNQLTARTVKAGTAWGSVRLALDTLDLDVTVSGGLVRTKATMSWTPGLVATTTSRYVTICPTDTAEGVSSGCTGRYVYDTVSVLPADSLEMSGSIQLPFDAAATGLWLWVGDEKQTAYVMDRWLATQQYTQIVGARRDPVLLETWGNGSYSIRLFPMKSGETRKMQIEIVQALKEGLALPIAARGRQQVYDYAKGVYVTQMVRPRVVNLVVRSDVNTTTSLDLGGLGRIPVGAGSTAHAWKEPDSLVMTISGKQPGIWTAVRDGKGAFGGAATLKGTELRFQAEPVNRLIVLDAADSLERVRKLALLALVKYGQAPHKVDLAWFDGQKLQKLWGDYRSMDEGTAAAEVLALLKGWKPSGPAAPRQVLKEVTKGDTGAVVVLVSTAKAPTRVWDCIYSTMRDTLQAKTYQQCYDAYNRFWNEYNASWTAVGKELAGAGQTLFGWWNDGYISYATSATGGFSFGSVTYPWNSWRWRGDSIVVPGLYGPNRFGYRENPQNLKLEIDGIEIDSLGYLFQPSYNYWYWGRGDVFLVDRIAVRTTAFVAGRTLASEELTGTYNDSLPVVYAARYARGGAATLKVSGTWGGLRFAAERRIDVPAPSGTEWGTRVWAGEYANMVQPWIWSDTAKQAGVRALGKAYEIVTPATSFLALEPGMKPLDSMAGTASGTSDAVPSTAKMVVSADWAASNEVATGFDNASLDDLLLGRITSVENRAIPAQVGLRIRSGSLVSLEVLGHDDGHATVRIVDLNGREVAKIAMTRSGDLWTASWKPIGRGVFFAVAEGARWKHTTRFTVGR